MSRAVEPPQDLPLAQRPCPQRLRHRSCRRPPRDERGQPDRRQCWRQHHELSPVRVPVAGRGLHAPPLPQGRFSGAYDYGFAYDINDAGQIVGGKCTGTGSGGTPLTRSSGKPGCLRDLGVLPPGGSTPNSSSTAFGVNHQGQVVGEFEYNGNVRHAVLWSNGSIRTSARSRVPAPRRTTSTAARSPGGRPRVTGARTPSSGGTACSWTRARDAPPPLTTPATSSASWAWTCCALEERHRDRPQRRASRRARTGPQRGHRRQRRR